MSNQKGFTPILGTVGILIVVVVVVLGNTIVRNFQNSKTTDQENTAVSQSKQISASTIPTVTNPVILEDSWQRGTASYKNPKIDITFEYPKEFNKIDAELNENNNGLFRVFIARLSTPEVSIEDRNKPNFDWKVYSENALSISLEVYDNADLSIQDFIKKAYSFNELGTETPAYTAILQNLVKLNIPVEGTYSYTTTKTNPRKYIDIVHKNKIYHFSLQGGTETGDKYSKSGERIFDQVISSIKLL